ncbi:MAG: tetratricopeptide repeat protein [Candidatus Omnitrophica bacterium]|nr:tetratricopeptide repeat protein [Candidatus Omnitrophota bacterium]
MERRVWRRLRFYIQTASILVPLAVFLVVYNRVVVDVNLQNLKLSLRILGRADAVGKAEAAMTLIDQNLLYSVGPAGGDASEVAALQYAKGVLNSDPRRMVEDAQTMVSTVVAKRIEERGGFVDTLDDLNEGVREAIQRVLLVPRFVLQTGKLSDQVDVELLSQAVRYERLGELLRAERIYHKLLDQHKNYRGRGDLKLRLGYLYHRQRSFTSAEKIYREVLKESPDPVEMGIARQLLARLKKAQRESEEIKALEKKLNQTVVPEQRQQLVFDLGVLQMQLFDFDGAVRSFKLSADAQPAAPLAAHAQFRRAWCLKYTGQYDDSVVLFEELTRLAPGLSMNAAAQAQIADAYRSTGRYEAAAEALESAASQAQDQALAAMFTAQVGSMHLIDLNDPEKAEAYFRRVEQSFPASSVSSVKQSIQQFQAEKALTRVKTERLEAGVPVFGWIEKSMPAFVEVFASRLAGYMKGVGETEVRRKLTEKDFKELVVRRVQEKFPGQMTDVVFDIEPDGFKGSMSVRVGMMWFPVAGKAKLTAVDGRLHVEVSELTVGHIPAPEALRTILETGVNETLDQTDLPLRIEQFETIGDGVNVHVKLK